MPQGAFRGEGQLGAGTEIERSGKRIIPVLQYPDGTYLADSTPILVELEGRFPERRLTPADPALAFLDRFLEDMADEALPVALFTLRWDAEEDQRFCARRQIIGWSGPIPSAELETAVENFRTRQVTNLGFLAPDRVSRDFWIGFYTGLLARLDPLLGERAFLLGGRPGFADFALYGQFSQMSIDPTPSRIMRSEALRVYQWTQHLHDCSGQEPGPLLAREALASPPFRALIDFLGRRALPLLEAVHAATAKGELMMQGEIDGAPIVTYARPYTAKVWGWLARDWHALAPADRAWLEDLLGPCGAAGRLTGARKAAARVEPFGTS
ncbi:MAG: glutathione S-transferase family protein [Alphaproteobacteria bacterium]|nr:glutathione S-transferase family protein [Alphaproteobacteria bacterium]